MRRLGYVSTTFAAMVLIAGCYAMGHKFNRVPLESIRLGKTTQAEILASVGPPRETLQMHFSGKPVTVIKYLDIEARGIVGDSGRSANFTFSDGTLVAFEFRSDYPGESTDFDESAAKRITVGKNTSDDVERLLGRPSGGAIYPALANPSESSALYSFIRGGSISPVFRKTAFYRFNNQGFVVFADVKNEEVKR